MTHRTTLTTMALATVLSTIGFGPLAQAQTLPPRAHHVRAITLPSPVDVLRALGVAPGSVVRAPSAQGYRGDAAQPADDGDDDDAAPNADGNDDANGQDDADAQDNQGSDDAQADAPEQPVAPAAVAPTGGTTYGIFVGISHYGGDNQDLPGSSNDAVQLAQTFEHAGWMRHGDGIVLTDANATADNVRQAFSTLGSRVRPIDSLVFFFDGHGNQTTLDLVGPDVSRSDLGRMLNRVQGRQLLVLDSCEAGGFAPLVQGHGDRAGLFSSRASELSSTAPSVHAGGWLAYSFRRAVGGGVRRRSDGSMDFAQVTEFVQHQYDAHDVTSGQHLVAVAGDPSRGFALGGTAPSTTVAAAPTAVATRAPIAAPAPVAAPEPVDAPEPSRPAAQTPDFGQLVGVGLGLANQVLGALAR